MIFNKKLKVYKTGTFNNNGKYIYVLGKLQDNKSDNNFILYTEPFTKENPLFSISAGDIIKTSFLTKNSAFYPYIGSFMYIMSKYNKDISAYECHCKNCTCRSA